MRVLASLSTVAVTTVVLASCGLDMGGLGEGPSTEGGTTLDSSSTAEGGSSSSGSSSGGGADAMADGSSSGTDSTAPPPDSSVKDTGSPADTFVPDTFVVETGPPPCTVANNCYVIPASWQLVAVDTSPSPITTSCPTGFAGAAPTDLDEGPNTSAACACGQCATTTQPTCPSGPIQDFYDVGQSGCGNAGNPGSNKNMSACNTDLYNGPIPFGYSNMDLKYVPPGATGGLCNSPGTPSGSVGYSDHDRACIPDSQASAGCVGNQCTLTLAPPYDVCVFQSGNQSCPGAPFTHQHLAGTGTTFTCSACGCNVTATCSGTMKLYTNGDCTTGGGGKEDDVVADGTCKSANTSQNSFASYAYVGNPPAGVTCAPSGTSNAQNVTLQNEETICCTQ